MQKALQKYLPGGKFNRVSAKRSQAMAAIKGRGNKTTEHRLRSALARAGISGWKLRPKGIPGNPDFFFPGSKTAVFVDGCFWHGCSQCGHIPKTNRRFWIAKIKVNRDRDRKTTRALRASQFTVLRFWEHQVTADLDRCVQAIRRTLKP